MIDSAGDVELSGLTLRDGRAGPSGSSRAGGAVSKLGTGALTIRDSGITDNTALADGAGLVAYGGGVYVAEGELLLERVTLARNSAIAANGASQARGGAIELGNDAGSATLRNVTVSGNEAAGPTSMGGGISNFALLAGSSVVLEHVTIAGNRATGGGAGGGLVGAVTTSVVDSVVAGNSASVAGPDCSTFGAPSIPAAGVNLIGDASGCTLGGGTTITGEPLLGPLQLNGPGGTETMALAAGSPALDAAPASGGGTCPPPATDQRGIARPQGSACDLGAYEARPAVAQLTPDDVDFGRQDPGDGPSAAETLTLANDAGADLDLQIGSVGVSGANPDQFLLDASGCPAVVEPGESCELQVRFDPSSAGAKNARLDVATSGGDLHSSLNGFAPPAVMTVTNLTDYGAGSLRDAIEQVASGGTVAFADGLSGTIGLVNGEIAIDRGVTVDGPGAGRLTIDAGDGSRIFRIDTADDVRLSGLTLTRGLVRFGSSALGGAIYKHGSGPLTVRDMAITDNAVTGAFGNWSYGGGVMVAQGELLMERVTLARNRSEGSPSYGGGLMLYSNVTATLRNVTATGNSATDGGGGIALWTDNGSSLLEHVTVAGNSASTGGGIATYNVDSATLVDSIVAGNVASDSGPDCFSRDTGSLTVRGVNLIEDISGCDLTGPGLGAVISGEDPGLGPLALNAPGTTATMALTAGSPALDAAPVSGDGACPPPATDQRGIARPQGAACDLGAFEARPAVASLAPASHDFGARQVDSGASAPAALTLANADDADLPLTTATVALGGADAGQFTLSAGDCPATLAPGASCALQATFAPTRTGAAEATVSDASASATLRGEGTAKPDPEPPTPPAPTPPTPAPPAPPRPRRSRR